jgi:CHAD domain-containing protein
VAPEPEPEPEPANDLLEPAETDFAPVIEEFAAPEAYAPPAEVDLPQLATDLIEMESELVDSAVPPWLETEAEGGFGDEADLLVAAPEEEPLLETITAPEEEPAEAPSPIEPPLKFPGVTADDAIAEAGRKVLKFHFLRLVAREPGTRSGKDPEDLHGMRVATRRLRAAWRVFGDAYKGDERKRQVSQLREVATRLGAVRDLDVLLLGLDEYRKPLPERERTAIEPLATEWRRRRGAARIQLMRELDSPDYQRFLTDLRTFVQTPGAGAARTDPTVPYRVRDTAASRVWNAYEQVRAFEPILRWADVTTLHELRLRAKWLRYSMEFIREALGPETPLIIARVVALQDHLGLMNDADVAVMAARTFLIQRAARLTEPEAAAIGRYLVSRERDVARLRQTVPTPWRAVASPQFRRALGRAIATL